EIEAVFEKWDLHAVQIGTVTDDGRVIVRWHGQVVADVPAEHLVLGGGAPVYHRETERPAYLDDAHAFDVSTIADVEGNATDTLLSLLGSPNIASKRWVFEQYDTMVRTNTVVGPGASDAAVVRIKGTDRALAVKTDCNGRYVHLNPRRGGRIAVAEAARNVVCAGGDPVAITNCLNYGNPYKPEVYWVFKESVGGMGDACRALGTPVTGGNVSFYNENPGGAVFPTPTIGMLGLVENVERDATRADFQAEGDAVLLLRPATWAHDHAPDATAPGLGGSEYLGYVHGQTTGDAPHLDLNEEVAVQQALLGLIRDGLVQSAHDVSDGGIAVCLAESALGSGLGADVRLAPGARLDAVLFGENQSRIVFTAKEADLDAICKRLDDATVRVLRIGIVTGSSLRVTVDNEVVLDADVVALRQPYDSAIPTAMGEAVAA
ncbi:MAG: AIR synthase related protein, partial [Bacteroidota bacterium]